MALRIELNRGDGAQGRFLVPICTSQLTLHLSGYTIAVVYAQRAVNRVCSGGVVSMLKICISDATFRNMIGRTCWVGFREEVQSEIVCVG